MSRQISMKLIPALLLGVFSGAVGASGFQLLEQGTQCFEHFALRQLLRRTEIIVPERYISSVPGLNGK